MNILFSPLGKTDPIKYNHDGAMLHICRYFDIDKVYWYMSKEICEEENKDSRFTICLERLATHMGKKIAHEIIRKEDLTDGVEKFDEFTEEFGSILNEICGGMTDKDNLYLNISSGTPAMKATLQYLITVTSHKMIPVQVYTPERKSNTKYEKRDDFDPELEWEYNEDNENGINRCIVSELSVYGARVQKKMIATLIDKYDYIGAWELAKTIRKNMSPQAFDLICASKDRYMLNAESAVKVFRKYNFKVIDTSYSDQLLHMFEYLLRIELLLRKGEFSDFIRSITPILADLYEFIIKKKCGLDINEYCTKGKWDKSKVEKNEQLLKVLDNGRDYTKQYYNNSSILVNIIRKFSDDKNIAELCEKLRFVEERVRNDTAHEIVYVSAETIQRKTVSKKKYPSGISPKEIVFIIIKIFELSGTGIKSDFLDSYDKMNDIIKGVLLQ